ARFPRPARGAAGGFFPSFRRPVGSGKVARAARLGRIAAGAAGGLAQVPARRAGEGRARGRRGRAACPGAARSRRGGEAAGRSRGSGGGPRGGAGRQGGEEMRAELVSLENHDEELARREAEVQRLAGIARALAERMSEKRRAAAGAFSKAVAQELSALGMARSEISVRFNPVNEGAIA